MAKLTYENKRIVFKYLISDVSYKADRHTNNTKIVPDRSQQHYFIYNEQFYKKNSVSCETIHAFREFISNEMAFLYFFHILTSTSIGTRRKYLIIMEEVTLGPIQKHGQN